MFVQVAAEVVDVLRLGERLGGVGLLRTEVGRWRVGHRVQRNLHVVSVAVFLKFHVRDLLVVDDGGVVSGHVARQFWEVRSHVLDVEESVRVVFNCYE